MAMVRDIYIYDSVQHRVLATQSQDQEDPIFKPVMVLAFALFLLTAPAPDLSVIAEMTSNFIVPASHSSVLPLD